MHAHRGDCRRLVSFAVLLFLLAAASRSFALPPAGSAPDEVQLAQAEQPPPRELQPRYEPVPPQPKSWYNSEYLFAMTRGVADSTMVPAVKAPLFLLTVPFDVILLPFTAIAGCFG